MATTKRVKRRKRKLRKRGEHAARLKALRFFKLLKDPVTWQNWIDKRCAERGMLTSSYNFK